MVPARSLSTGPKLYSDGTKIPSDLTKLNEMPEAGETSGNTPNWPPTAEPNAVTLRIKLLGLVWPEMKLCATRVVPFVVSPPGPYTFATVQATLRLSALTHRPCAPALAATSIPNARIANPIRTSKPRLIFASPLAAGLSLSQLESILRYP